MNFDGFTDSAGNRFGMATVPMTQRLAPTIGLPKVIWRPLKGIKHEGHQLAGSQQLYMSCHCDHVLYHGSRGPGKTDAQVMQFRSMVGRGYGAYWKGVIFDRRYGNLDDLIAKAKRWFFQFNDGVKFLSSKGDLKFVWPTGEELLFRKFARSEDYWDYHGQEFPFIGWNELTKFPTSEFYDLLMSCNRSSFIPIRHSPQLSDDDHRLLDACDYDLDQVELRHGPEVEAELKRKLIPRIPLWVRATTNPYGPGRTWVKRRFIDVCDAGHVYKVTTDVFNPQTQKREPVTKTQTHIFGSYKENIYLDPAYVADLENITEENKRQAWLYGNWNITAGGAFDDLWRDDIHKLRRFKLPPAWSVIRCFDWGSTHPFCVGWWALCDGTEVEWSPGKKWCPPRGTLILVAEWYGCAKDAKGNSRIGDNVGLKMSAGDIAKGIKIREEMLVAGGWIGGKVSPGPADNQIRDVREVDVETIEKKMSDEGIDWTTSDKSGGSRKIGLQLMRDRLQASVLKEGPGVYFMDNCRDHLAIIPTLPRDEDDPDDIDTEAEDHPWDSTRYVILGSDIRAAKELKLKLPF